MHTQTVSLSHSVKAGTSPNVQDGARGKFEPNKSTLVPPVMGPERGLMRRMCGGRAGSTRGGAVYGGYNAIVSASGSCGGGQALVGNWYKGLVAKLTAS